VERNAVLRNGGVHELVRNFAEEIMEADPLMMLLSEADRAKYTTELLTRTRQYASVITTLEIGRIVYYTQMFQYKQHLYYLGL
jgi:hypothetical protein